MLVNASQRVIFDPAGTIKHDIFIEQDLDVSSEIAERALQLVRANGPVTSAFCASASSAILRQIPGFEGIDQTISWPPISQKSGAFVNKNYMNTTMPTNVSR